MVKILPGLPGLLTIRGSPLAKRDVERADYKAGARAVKGRRTPSLASWRESGIPAIREGW
jgi:hypothetical protein